MSAAMERPAGFKLVDAYELGKLRRQLDELLRFIGAVNQSHVNPNPQPGGECPICKKLAALSEDTRQALKGNR